MVDDNNDLEHTQGPSTYCDWEWRGERTHGVRSWKRPALWLEQYGSKYTESTGCSVRKRGRQEKSLVWRERQAVRYQEAGEDVTIEIGLPDWESEAKKVGETWKDGVFVVRRLAGRRKRGERDIFSLT